MCIFAHYTTVCVCECDAMPTLGHAVRRTVHIYRMLTLTSEEHLPPCPMKEVAQAQQTTENALSLPTPLAPPLPNELPYPPQADAE